MKKLDPIQQRASDQFSRQSSRYGKGHVLEDISDLLDALKHVILRRGQKALDIATGAGHTGLHLASLGLHVTASDVSPMMLALTRKMAEARGLSVETKHHTAEELPYGNCVFDLVTCRVAAHHFSSPETFVKQAARVLRHGGAFVLIDGTVEDGQPEAEEWTHQVEKLRDPSHNRLLTPGRWSALCKSAGLKVKHWSLNELKQPDLEWYFETAATPPKNRKRVRKLIEEAPESARRLFRIREEDGKTIWWWQRVKLVAFKP